LIVPSKTNHRSDKILPGGSIYPYDLIAIVPICIARFYLYAPFWRLYKKYDAIRLKSKKDQYLSLIDIEQELNVL